MPGNPSQVRQVGSYLILAAFVSFVLLLGISDETRDAAHGAVIDSLDTFKPSSKDSDFGQYVYLRTMGSTELDFETSGRRVIILGDIHGMNDSLDQILTKLNYAPPTDLLIHVGDIVAKGPLAGSLAVLEYMAGRNITGVRGNHDQKALEWRVWLERVLAQPDGQAWLEEMERKNAKELGAYSGAGWKRIPRGWEMMGDHYQIARAMSASQYAYLLALPLVLHIPQLHTFVVHAGVLPLDPRRSVTSVRQPLAHVPNNFPDQAGAVDAGANMSVLRHAQERAVLADVPQNTDPWVVLNMRSILRDNSVTKDTSKGEPWAALWNAIISRCDGFDPSQHLDLVDGGESSDAETSRAKTLPCYPATVIYGHAAARGLDVKRWSTGLDSGCVYGRKLTAMVLTSARASDANDIEAESIKFGEKGVANARLVNVNCPKPKT